MRTLKFRAWDKEYKSFKFFSLSDMEKMTHQSTEYFLIGASSRKESTHWEEIPYTSSLDVELMQFTGLHDKNGTPIFEGDIVNEFRISRSYPNGRDCKHVIKWEEDMTLDDSYGMRVVGFCLYGGVLEVIGNIYENPELLTPTQSDQT